MALAQYKKVTLLFHASAGSGAGGKHLPQVVERVRTLFFHAELEMVETQSKEHIVNLGQTSTADLILCLTGDGSVHDLAQNLVGRPRGERPVVALLPAGSGNDYARTLGIPLDPLKALAVLGDCVPTLVDVGCVNQIYFLETLSFGVDAAVALNTEELRRKTGSRGLRLYARAAVSAIIHELNPHKVRAQVEGRELTLNPLILAIQNGRTYGSGFMVAPNASVTDGKLDGYYCSDISKLTALYYLFRMKNGRHENLKHFSHFSTDTLELELEEQVPIQCDGERLLGRKFSISVVPKALEVLALPTAPACKKKEKPEFLGVR